MVVDINQHIEFRPKRAGDERPYLKGTRVEVIQIVADAEYHDMTPEEIAEGYPHVPLAAIYAALAFYHDNREAVRAMMRQDEALIEQSQRTGLSEQTDHERARPLSP